MLHDLVPIVVPIGICVVLPVLVVWLVTRSKSHKVDKNADVLIKAIENNSSIDADKLLSALATPEKTSKELLSLRLLRGCIFSLIGLAILIVKFSNVGFDESILTLLSCCSLAVGISYLVVYFVTRKKIESDTE